jgi:hypothetical protein
MTTTAPAPVRLPRTLRTDTWWRTPLTTVVVLLAFIAYGTWAAFNGDYHVEP